VDVTPTDDKGVHTHDFRDGLHRCLCGASDLPPDQEPVATARWVEVPVPGIDSPGRDALADAMRRALDEDMQYDDDDWTRLADAALTHLREQS
jgi:hypothetical protein